jgi:hypothetical protein
MAEEKKNQGKGEEEIRWELEDGSERKEEQPVPEVTPESEEQAPEAEELREEYAAAGESGQSRETPEPEPSQVDESEAEPVPAGGGRKQGEGEVEAGTPSAPGEPPYGTGREWPGATQAVAWQWRETGASFSPFVLEFMGGMYRVSKRGIERVSDLSSMRGYFKYFIDYGESPGLGILTLNTEKKYANVLARKHLEEIGELSSESVMEIFSKRRVSGGQIRLFYEVLPRDSYVALKETYNSYSDGFIIYDSVAMLHSLLKKRGRGVHALAMHLPGTIVMIAGRDGETHLARRYTLVGEDEQALAEGIYALQQDVSALERNLGQRVDVVEWIEGLTWDLNIPKPPVEISFSTWPVHALRMDNETVWTALPLALKQAPVTDSLGPSEEHWLRPLERAEKLLWVVMLALAIVAGVGVYSMQNVVWQAERQVQAMRNRVNAMESELRARQLDTEYGELEDVVDLATDFKLAAVSPPYGELWNYLAEQQPEGIRVDGLEFNYQSEAVNLRLEGEVERDITRAQRSFDGFLDSLEKAGFEVTNHRLDLDVEGNFYSLNIQWPLKVQGE